MLRKLKPITNGTRFVTYVDYRELSKSKPPRSLIKRLKKKGGRNNLGRITIRFRGGGHKKKYRLIDFRRDKLNVPAKVVSIEYDPNRTAFIALLSYADGEKRYIIAPEGMKIGDIVKSGYDAEILPGNTLELAKIPTGTMIHNIELKPGKGGQLVRSAGCYAMLMANEGNYALIRLPSGEMRYVLNTCKATIGQVSNQDHQNVSIGKAGRMRWMGRRPHVRGAAMNPCDHPHGGGEGKAGQGNPHPVSPWGWHTKGKKTRKKKPSDKLILKRRK